MSRAEPVLPGSPRAEDPLVVADEADSALPDVWSLAVGGVQVRCQVRAGGQQGRRAPALHGLTIGLGTGTPGTKGLTPGSALAVASPVTMVATATTSTHPTRMGLARLTVLTVPAGEDRHLGNGGGQVRNGRTESRHRLVAPTAPDTPGRTWR